MFAEYCQAERRIPRAKHLIEVDYPLINVKTYHQNDEEPV
jgi:hypothetical protein